MADGFDPCECINLLNQQQRMQRLINILRDSQNLCNDNECFNGAMPGPSTAGVVAPGEDSTQLSLMTVMIGWIVIAMILFFLRPNTWRRSSETKKRSNGGHDDRDPDRRFVL